VNAGRANSTVINVVGCDDRRGIPQAVRVAMNTKGPRLIEARLVQDLRPVIDAVHKARV